jgi:hypothetical protein
MSKPLPPQLVPNKLTIPAPGRSRGPSARTAAGRWPLLAGLALLAACGSDTDPGPGGVTVGEARALDDAASMLDEQRLDLPPAAEAAAEGTEVPAAD